MATLTIETPRVFAPLLRPARYKGCWGGRGSGKSHFFAEMLVEKCMLEPGTRFVCIREIQKSLNQSVKRLIEDKIERLGLGPRFKVLESVIHTPGNGLIVFQGMQNHTADTIKSLEGFSGAWVEEAQSLSAHSLRLLRPTLRKDGSEIWMSWNPESADDPVDALLRGPDRIQDAIVVKANWRDNPWFPSVLEDERRRDLNRDPDEYDHVWEGGYLTISDAIIFRNRVSVDTFETPSDARFFHGADWGFSQDPTVLIRCFVERETLFVDQEAFGHGVELDDTPALFDSIPTSRKWPIKADSARPETISHVRRRGFHITPADKWKGSVEDGIACLKGFKRIVVHERCQHTAKEFRLYSYKVDRVNGDVLPIIVDKYNHCIAQGQLIETIRGHLPVEHVRVGDLVATRAGWRRVYSSGLTSTDREWWEIRAGGRSLLATRDHKVFTTNRGFVSVDTLSYTDEILVSAGESCQRPPGASRSERQSNTVAIHGTGIQRLRDHLTGITSAGRLALSGCRYTCTGPFTKTITGLFRRVFTSTTRTVTQATTTFSTLNVSRPKSMQSGIQKMMQCMRGGLDTLPPSGISPLLGIVRQKVMSFTSAMAGAYGRLLSLSMQTAAIARGNSKSGVRVGICSAPAHANLLLGELPVPTTRTVYASDAKAHSVATATRTERLVPARVQCVCDTGMRGPVYDISVEGEPEFVAGGILVHNCIDALRYALDGYIKGRGTMRINPEALRRI